MFVPQTGKSCKYSTKNLYSGYSWRKDCPDYLGVLISGVEGVLWLITVDYLVPVACVHIRGVSGIQGSGLEWSTVHTHVHE